MTDAAQHTAAPSETPTVTEAVVAPPTPGAVATSRGLRTLLQGAAGAVLALGTDGALALVTPWDIPTQWMPLVTVGIAAGVATVQNWAEQHGSIKVVLPPKVKA
jgi:hypothetical protein